MEDSEGTPPGVPESFLAHLQELASEDVTGYKGPGGIVLQSSEMPELFNLLEQHPAEWNHRLRVVLAAWILHLMKEGRLQGRLEYQ